MRTGRAARPPATSGRPRPMRHASRSAASAASTRAAGTTAVIPIPTLKVRTISSSAMSPRCWIRLKIAGTGQEPVSISTPRPSGRVRGRFPSQPPPVMMGECTDVAARRAQRPPQDADLVEVRPMRLQERLADRAAVVRHRLAPTIASGRTRRARRVAVRVQPGRRQPEHDVAGCARAEPSMRSPRATTPTMKPDEVVVVADAKRSGICAVSPPISGMPAAAQPRATPPTISSTTSARSVAEGEVVEEEERVGAGDDDVVDACVDEVDPDRVVTAERHARPSASCRRRPCC